MISTQDLLTCKLYFSLSTDDGPKRVGGDALINSSVIDNMWIIYQ